MLKVQIEDNKNNIIKKHNDLIKKARYTLSEQGIKLVSILISMIRVDDADFQEYNIQVKDFAKMINSTSGEIYKQVDNLTDEIMKQPFKIGDEKFNWCYYARYKENEAYLTLKIAPELKPYLLELKSNFTEYNIHDILILKSRYVIRFYEYCILQWRQYKAYKTQHKTYTFEIKIDELRELFQIPESYLYKDIRVHILDKAVKQFEEKTNIKIKYEEIKTCRKVNAIKITISDNLKGSNDFLATQEKFVAYIRANYKPDTDKKIYPSIAKLKYSNKECYCKLDNNGYLYLQDIENLVNIDLSGQQAKDIWEAIYKATKQNSSFLIQNKE